MSASNAGLGLTVPGLLVILAMVGVLVFPTGPLETLRPPNPNLADQTFSDQQATARLWQDPFEAAEQHLKSQAGVPAPAAAPRRLRDLSPQTGGGVWGAPILDTDWLAAATLVPDRGTLDWLALTADGHADAVNLQPCRPADQAQVLAVLAEAGPYAESAESRLRIRYAILSALDVSGYQPVDATHVGYFQPVGDPALPKLVPYERLERKAADGTSESLMLLWLDGAIFKREPSRRIRAVVDAIPATVLRRECIAGERIGVLGPAGSDGLAALLKEAQERAGSANGPPAVAERRLEFYSAAATATDMSLIAEVLGSDAANDGSSSVAARIQGDGLALPSRTLGVGFHRLIPNDEQLARRLGRELRERGLFQGKPIGVFAFVRQLNDSVKNGIRSVVQAGAGKYSDDCKSGKDKHVVLIAEWDTTYGRSLPVAVANQLLREKCYKEAEKQETRDQSFPRKDCERDRRLSREECDKQVGTLKTLDQFRDDCRDQDRGSQTKGQTQRGCWLHYFSYMRGLDGNIPAGKDKQDGPRSASQSVAGRAVPSVRSTPGSERAEGQAQLDYLRRLTTELAALKNDDGTPARIAAIGILGSDLHDKMLILQALRAAFRSPPLFFTTDLDARMFDAAYADWTHGLIVASGFGLSAGEYDRDATIPPFRGNYQTAIYHAVRDAFPGPGAPPEHRVARCAEQDPASLVKLYELGRDGPQDYPDTALDTASDEECRRLAAPAGGTGDSSSNLHLKFYIDAVVAAFYFVLTLAGVFVFYRPDVRRFLCDHPLRSLAWVAVGLVLISIVLLTLPHSQLGCPLRTDPACPEPFSLTSGISGWMSIYLTALALVLSFLFLGVLLIKRCHAIGEIERRYIAAPVADSGHDLIGSPSIRETLAAEAGRRLATPLKSMWQAIRRFLGLILCRPARAAVGDRSRRSDQAKQVWERHRRRVAIGWHTLFPILLAVLFYFFVINLFAVTGGGGGGGTLRGEDLRALASDLRILSTWFLSLLVFLYLDIAARARELIADLSRKDLLWPDQVRRHYAIKELKVDRCFVDQWISLRVVARYADMVVRSVAYPLVVLLLLVAARMPWFDTNTLPIGILIAYVVLAFYLLGSAWLVQRAARTLRSDILADYRRCLRELDPQSPSESRHRRQLEDLIERVESMHDFAFQRFSENPLVRAAILPFGSLGLGLLDFLS